MPRLAGWVASPPRSIKDMRPILRRFHHESEAKCPLQKAAEATKIGLIRQQGHFTNPEASPIYRVSISSKEQRPLEILPHISFMIHASIRFSARIRLQAAGVGRLVSPQYGPPLTDLVLPSVSTCFLRYKNIPPPPLIYTAGVGMPSTGIFTYGICMIRLLPAPAATNLLTVLAIMIVGRVYLKGCIPVNPLSIFSIFCSFLGLFCNSYFFPFILEKMPLTFSALYEHRILSHQRSYSYICCGTLPGDFAVPAYSVSASGCPILPHSHSSPA